MDYAVSFFMLGEVARLTTAAIFAVAAFHAMSEWTVFGGIVEQYRIAPRRLALMAARVLPPLEVAAAAALVLPMTSGIGAVAGLCLMALFTTAITVNLARGRVSIDCGCGGASGQKLSPGLAVRNLVVAFGLVIALMAPPRGEVDSVSAIGVIGASLALIGLYFAVNQLMTNNQAFGALGSRTR
ncbi:MAG TPA: MauE/DoxX family redox-associated membrane protein [Steroidobacteraceae bacterium]|nr:MauE/DoxX family redox-associated membrane protein [Steroidobacteraceae bacterium]